MKELRRCTNCNAPFINGRRGVCEPCCDFKRRNGHLPADHEIQSRKAVFRVCPHCKTDYADGDKLCRACATWQRRHETPRPKYLWQKFCKDCKDGKIIAKGLCINCYQWRTRHNGKPRPRYKFATACTNCGKPNLYAKGLCTACYQYQKINHKARPEKLWRQRWNPIVSAKGNSNAPKCKVCGKPAIHPKWHDLAGGRCNACYTYWRKHGRREDRPARLWQRWAPYGWCECGAPAVTEVTLTVDHGAQTYKLCRDCYQLEVGP